MTVLSVCRPVTVLSVYRPVTVLSVYSLDSHGYTDYDVTALIKILNPGVPIPSVHILVYICI